MSKTAVLSHLRAAAAAHRKHPARSPIVFDSQHVATRMIERGISVEDIVRSFEAPKPADVRESVNAAGRWEVWGQAAGGFRFYAVVALELRPSTVLVTVVRPEKGTRSR